MDIITPVISPEPIEETEFSKEKVVRSDSHAPSTNLMPFS